MPKPWLIWKYALTASTQYDPNLRLWHSGGKQPHPAYTNVGSVRRVLSFFIFFTFSHCPFGIFFSLSSSFLRNVSNSSSSWLLVRLTKDFSGTSSLGSKGSDLVVWILLNCLCFSFLFCSWNLVGKAWVIVVWPGGNLFQVGRTFEAREMSVDLVFFF